MAEDEKLLLKISLESLEGDIDALRLRFLSAHLLRLISVLLDDHTTKTEALAKIAEVLSLVGPSPTHPQDLDLDTVPLRFEDCERRRDLIMNVVFGMAFNGDQSGLLDFVGLRDLMTKTASPLAREEK